jgi:hypothetical protein
MSEIWVFFYLFNKALPYNYELASNVDNFFNKVSAKRYESCYFLYIAMIF